jgi:protein DGCR14
MASSPPKSTALTQKRPLDVAAAMPPPPPPKRNKRPAVVLPEDAYLAGLSHVIARDYFPGLLQTEARQELLDALEAKDEAWIRDAGARLRDALEGKGRAGRTRRGVSLPQHTPSSFAGDTPASSVARGGEDEDKGPDAADLEQLSLTAFQAKYTSEDNESFNALIDRQNAKNRAKHAYLWSGNQIPTARQIAYRTEQVKLLESAPTSNALELRARDARPARPNHRPAAPRNALMFGPEGVEDDGIETVAQAAEARSLAPPKAVAHANTRLDPDAARLAAHAIPPSPSLSALNDAIAGRPRLGESEAGWETPRVAGYAFVDAEPTAAEARAFESGGGGGGGKIDAAAILSSLAAASGARGAAGGTPFEIKHEGKRDALHRRLLERGKDAKRGLAAPGTPTPGGGATPRAAKVGSLTPAGRMLYDRMRGDERGAGAAAAAVPRLDATPAGKRSRGGLLPGLTPKARPKTGG